MRSFFLFLIGIIPTFVFVNVSCDHGLDPQRDPLTPGFDGRVSFVDGWSDDSEVREVYVVVFKTIPKDSADAVNQFFLGNIRFTELTPPFQNEYNYSFDLAPGSYELVACVGILGDLFFDVSNWVLSGIYSETNNPFEPSKITIPDNNRLSSIDITASVIFTLPLPF